MAFPAYRSFQEVQAAIADELAAGRAEDAERLAARLFERAKLTGAREHDAAAWFARGLVQDGTRRYDEAVKSLRVAVDTCRKLFPAANNSLGVAARALGITYGHINRPEEAVEMFILARNVFEKTDPELAPEVIRLSASCLVAVRRLDEALAVIHQTLGPPDALTPLRSPEELDLYLLRARILEEQHKPAQALKARARVTGLLTSELHVRAAVAQAWLGIARSWARTGGHGARHALHCAVVVDGGRQGNSRLAIAETLRELHLTVTNDWHQPPLWQVQRQTSGGAVAFACPIRGLFFARVAERIEQNAIVLVREGAEARIPIEPVKLILGNLNLHQLEPEHVSAARLVGNVLRGPFREGDSLVIEDGYAEPSHVRVLSLMQHGLLISRPAEGSGLQHYSSVVGAVLPTPLPRSNLPQNQDDIIRELLI